LLLPHNNEQSFIPHSYTDVTHLFKVMAQSEHFVRTVGQTSQDHKLALAEAQELEDVLRAVSQEADLPSTRASQFD
jgi:hypothetical protein